MPANRPKSSHPKQVDPAEKQLSDFDSLKDTLRKAYEGVKSERVPDRLQRLIDALREAELASKDSDPD